MTCPVCGGSGYIEEDLDDDGEITSKEECQECDGTGEIDDE